MSEVRDPKGLKGLFAFRLLLRGEFRGIYAQRRRLLHLQEQRLQQLRMRIKKSEDVTCDIY